MIFYFDYTYSIAHLLSVQLVFIHYNAVWDDVTIVQKRKLSSWKRKKYEFSFVSIRFLYYIHQTLLFDLNYYSLSSNEFQTVLLAAYDYIINRYFQRIDPNTTEGEVPFS